MSDTLCVWPLATCVELQMIHRLWLRVYLGRPKLHTKASFNYPWAWVQVSKSPRHLGICLCLQAIGEAQSLKETLTKLGYWGGSSVRERCCLGQVCPCHRATQLRLSWSFPWAWSLEVGSFGSLGALFYQISFEGEVPVRFTRKWGKWSLPQSQTS